ncbi:RagB/SusD family nutrient uptake outer membrane protein [Dyadobacter diqingensis]|uniref:RagB/SusD family nutrient uptake outer membrane protein n=1 Tax=Dyadobacter diqingensis TaxID=2938121 RepID=UPI0020C1AA29|nr:RagB/SusD family nutrient uptake outer membrane protein [Dyadobacter diqingensis]
MKTVKNLILALVIMGPMLCCESGFLDKKPQKSLLVPTTLGDMQALLDNSRDLMNVSPYLNVITDGEFRLLDAGLNSVARVVQNAYVWSSEPPATQGDWDIPYKQVFYCNVVLDGLAKLTDQASSDEYKRIRGDALFFRGLALFNLVQLFSVPYKAGSADTKMGIPLPLSSDVNLKMPRASLKATYDQVLKDLLEAAPLLAARPLYLTRPSKAALQALLARVYLLMGDYALAAQHADAALALQNSLLDYNTVPTQSAISFPLPLSAVNPEVLFYSRANTSFLNNASVFADSALYSAYSENDLRKKIYFTSALKYKGSYTGTANPFQGLSTDELYLIKAECQARIGAASEALKTLDVLLQKRCVTGRYQPLTALSTQQVLEIIITERRKELVGRGLWWQDLRRLSGDSGFSFNLKRVSSGVTHLLVAGDKRYVFKIPLDELAGNPMEQNP